MHQYYIYILASHSRVLYVGVTNDLARRTAEHLQDLMAGFAKKYHAHRLVYYEVCGDVNSAIAREKQLKNWRRNKKVTLIEQRNPGWADLSDVIMD
jgi:putative endonuclease